MMNFPIYGKHNSVMFQSPPTSIYIYILPYIIHILSIYYPYIIHRPIDDPYIHQHPPTRNVCPGRAASLRSQSGYSCARRFTSSTRLTAAAKALRLRATVICCRARADLDGARALCAFLKGEDVEDVEDGGKVMVQLL